MNRAVKLQALQALGLCDLLQTDEIGTELPSCPSSRLEVPRPLLPLVSPFDAESERSAAERSSLLVKVRILAREVCRPARRARVAFFIVKSGAIKIVTESAMKAAGGDGTTLIESELLSKGECFGEAALLLPSSTGVGKMVGATNDTRYSVTAFAHDESGDVYGRVYSGAS